MWINSSAYNWSLYLHRGLLRPVSYGLISVVVVDHIASVCLLAIIFCLRKWGEKRKGWLMASTQSHNTHNVIQVLCIEPKLYRTLTNIFHSQTHNHIYECGWECFCCVDYKLSNRNGGKSKSNLERIVNFEVPGKTAAALFVWCL